MGRTAKNPHQYRTLSIFNAGFVGSADGEGRNKRLFFHDLCRVHAWSKPKSGISGIVRMTLILQPGLPCADGIRCVPHHITQSKNNFSFYKIYIYYNYNQQRYSCSASFVIYYIYLILFSFYNCIAKQFKQPQPLFDFK